MLNRKLLFVSSGALSPSTIGVAGGQGFGVGVYPGSKAELAAMGFPQWAIMRDCGCCRYV